MPPLPAPRPPPNPMPPPTRPMRQLPPRRPLAHPQSRRGTRPPQRLRRRMPPMQPPTTRHGRPTPTRPTAPHPHTRPHPTASRHTRMDQTTSRRGAEPHGRRAQSVANTRPYPPVWGEGVAVLRSFGPFHGLPSVAPPRQNGGLHSPWLICGSDRAEQPPRVPNRPIRPLSCRSTVWTHPKLAPKKITIDRPSNGPCVFGSAGVPPRVPHRQPVLVAEQMGVGQVG